MTPPLQYVMDATNNLEVHTIQKESGMKVDPVLLDLDIDYYVCRNVRQGLAYINNLLRFH
jgi:hypothetical protein